MSGELYLHVVVYKKATVKTEKPKDVCSHDKTLSSAPSFKDEVDMSLE